MKQAGTNLGWKLSYKEKTVLEGELVSEGKDICIEAEIPEVHTWTAETPELYEFYSKTEKPGGNSQMWIPQNRDQR